MWRRFYLVLLILRVYFALSPSYLHPDEVFQGPEVIAGEVFGYRNVRTWEWTVTKPIRSVFPLWPVYGLPMTLLKVLWSRDSDGAVEPATIFYTTRIVMLVMCFVLQDWAIHELVHSRRRQKDAIILVASSYVTWTFQTHTFSNSVETLVVLWCLVLMQKMAGSGSTPSSPTEEKSPGLSSDAVPRRLFATSGAVLGCLVVFGIFNRITFPAFLLIPGTQLLPLLVRRPVALIVLVVSTAFWLFIAIATDTGFYNGPAATKSFSALFNHIHTLPVITPINNLLYNTKASNLKQHGLHPHYQHFLVNLPQLLGPALLLFPLPLTWSHFHFDTMLHNTRLTAAITGAVILSFIPHQEPRFLLPCVPLFLTCVCLPDSKTWRRRFWITWAIFNGIMGILMGVYHQAGVIPAQIAMPDIIRNSLRTSHSPSTNVDVYWWKTYPPPLYLLGPPTYRPDSDEIVSIDTHPLLGANRTSLLSSLGTHLPTCESQNSMLRKFTNAISNKNPHQVLLAAPFAAFRFDSDTFFPDHIHQPIPPISNFTFILPRNQDETHLDNGLRLTHLATFRKHINLDDMDFADDGVLETLGRVIGRRGLGVWKVERVCASGDQNQHDHIHD